MSELHFILIDYNETQVVKASDKKEAMETAEWGDLQDPMYLCSESDLKKETEEGEVTHL